MRHKTNKTNNLAARRARRARRAKPARTPIEGAKAPYNDDRLLTEAEAADRLSLSVRTLQRMRTNDTGPAYSRVGPRAAIRYRESDLAAYIDSCIAVSMQCREARLTLEPR
jgi:predicted DNA-binding transcriptional regulator AlpA